MKKGAFIIVILTALLSGHSVSAQKFAVKPYVDLGIGGAMSIKSELPDMSRSSSNVDFGVDFGYTFWQLGGNHLEANIGIGYSTTGLRLGVENLSYSYSAPATADEDGNPYIRYYDLSSMQQKLRVGYFMVPVYLSYGYQFSEKMGVHADLGFKFGFKTNAKLNSVSGEAESYGVYPEYDNLMVDAPWINGFGQSPLTDSNKGEVSANGFYASLLIGASFDVNVTGPLWFNVGLRYNCGFTDSFKKTGYGSDNYTAETAPVTYTVAEGQEVRPLTDCLKSSKLSPFSIHVGFTVKF